MDKFFKWEPIVIAIGLSIALFVVFLCSSCTYYFYTSDGYRVPVIHSEAEAIYWIDHHISYESDKVLYGCSDYWASPDEVLSKSAGDCEDMAILYLVMFYENLGYEGTLNVVTKGPLTIDSIGHAYGSANGYDYYLVSGYTNLCERYSYKQALLKIGTSYRSIDKSDDLIVGGHDDQR